MARKIYIATKYPRIGESISKTFENSRVDDRLNKIIYFPDIDFESHSKYNTLANDLVDYPLTIHEHDLDAVKSHNKERLGKKITIKDLIEGLKESLAESWKGKLLFIVAKPEYMDELKQLVKDGVLSQSQILSSKIMEKRSVNLDPFSDEHEVIIKDDEVKSLEDIRKTIKKAKEAAATS